MSNPEEQTQDTTEEQPDPKVHTVAIARCGSSYIIEPKNLLIKLDEQVRFLSLGAEELILLFPKPLFEGEEYAITTRDGMAGPYSLQVTQPGCYPYAIAKKGTNGSGYHFIDPTLLVYRH